MFRAVYVYLIGLAGDAYNVLSLLRNGVTHALEIVLYLTGLAHAKVQIKDKKLNSHGT